MAERGIILPAGPLFMVDKSWKLQNASTTKTTRKIREDVKVLKCVRTTPNDVSSQPRLNLHQRLSWSSPDHSGFQFIAATVPGGRQDQNAREAVRRHVRKLDRIAARFSTHKDTARPKSTTAASSPRAKPKKSRLNPGETLYVHRPVPSSTSPSYGVLQGEKQTGLEEYLQYYRYQIAGSSYPLERYVVIETNPIRGICLPLALSDRLFFETVMLVSVVHHSFTVGTNEPKDADELARSVLGELRRRVMHREISDTTLLSVSCIALLENVMGHHDQWMIHAAGMKEMVACRGGINNMSTSIKWKIYRADVVGAIDRITKPLLPSPGKQNLLRGLCDDSMEIPTTHFLDHLQYSTNNQSLQSVFCDMYKFTSILNHAINKGTAVDFHFIDDNCIYIQHELLQAQTDSMLDESLKLTGLVFMNTMTRAQPFSASKCAVLASRLKSALENALPNLENQPLALWLTLWSGLVSMETEQHIWSKEKFVDLVHSCGCRSWNDIKKILSDILWLEPLHSEFGFKLWDEVKEMTASRPYSFG